MIKFFTNREALRTNKVIPHGWDEKVSLHRNGYALWIDSSFCVYKIEKDGSDINLSYHLDISDAIKFCDEHRLKQEIKSEVIEKVKYMFAARDNNKPSVSKKEHLEEPL